MLVLEHFTKAGARVLTIRPFARATELMDLAQPGDAIYTIPDDSDYRSTDKLLQAVSVAPKVGV